MAVLIPSIGSVASRMTVGERRVAERLEQKLDAEHLVWYDVPVGPNRAHPDFVLLHPRRGLLILEVKDWKLDTIRLAGRQDWTIVPHGLPKTVVNPAEQARHYAHQVVDALCRDRQLVHAEGRWQGMLTFPWSYGVVFTHITRRQFDAAGLQRAIEPHRVVCADEMTEAVDPEAFRDRLRAMFPVLMRGTLTPPQIERVRWTLFPEVRVPAQGLLHAADPAADDGPPDLVKVMDLQQEQLARSLGDGHRVIHGVAGSGKTMILGYRAEHLARTADGKPVLVLCYNRPLAEKLEAFFAARGLAGRVQARGFHQWCRQQLVAHGQPVPEGRGLFERMVQDVIEAVARGRIPAGQYQAVLIDEGHDFRPEWLQLVTRMVDPRTNSLLLLYDDAQSIYERQHSRQFSFKSVGIQAQGRTTILRVNYRNTRQILETARALAAELLTPEERDDDGVPLLQPLSCGREGQAPQVMRLPSLRDEARHIAELLMDAHRQGHAWSDMAVLCRHYGVMDECAEALRHRRVPHQLRKGSVKHKPSDDGVAVMTMHASKGLEFPLVALPGLGQMPTEGEDEKDEARLFYVAATRATQRLLLTTSGEGAFGLRLQQRAQGLSAAPVPR